MQRESSQETPSRSEIITPQLRTPLPQPNNNLQMPQIQRPLLTRSQDGRRLDSALDLPTIERILSSHLNVILAELSPRPEDLDEVGPDLGPGLFRQVLVGEGDVDAGFEGGVDGSHSVGGEDHDAFVVF